MHPLLKKLNFKGQPNIIILHHPASFQSLLDEIQVHVNIITHIDRVSTATFVMAFVKTKYEVDRTVFAIAPLLEGDAIFWMCYPKSTSKKYTCDFNRDTGWDIFGEFGMEGVRQVAIDEDWSALRFRKASYIKSMKRKFKALSPEGKVKSGQKED